MGAQFSQFFPPKPQFTETDVGSQRGKVYIAGRSAQSAEQAIEKIESFATTGGSVHFLALDLADLSTIRAAADEFKSKESKLDVLWNNAGVSQPPLGSKSSQGFELQLATNCLGPFLLTQLLLPVLEKAATSDMNALAVAGRVVWLSSQVMELSAPKGALAMSDLANTPNDQVRNYTTSKTANYPLSCELARREGMSKRIISVAINPGAANTRLLRHSPWMKMMARPLMYKPQLAACTELYAGLSLEINFEHNGCYVIPWGRIHDSLREDIVLATQPIDEGGEGTAMKLWEFCEQMTGRYK